MRLPKRFRNRWAYAGTAALSVILFLSLWTGSVGGFENGIVAMPLSVIVSSTGSALLYWPRKKRSRGLMAIIGACVVLTAFVLFLPLSTLFSAIGAGTVLTVEFWLEWIGYMAAVPAVVLFGSIVTLGLPYLIGITLSILFGDEGRSAVD